MSLSLPFAALVGLLSLPAQDRPAANVSSAHPSAGIEAHDVLAPLRVVPIRRMRPTTVGAEVGFNGLAGASILVGHHVHPLFAVEGAAGLSSQGPKLGLRGRVNVLSSDVTPFFAGGLNYGFGMRGSIGNAQNGSNIRVQPRRALYAQGVAGVAWTSRQGLSVQASGGWAQLVSGNPVVVTEGSPNPTQRQWIRRTTRSGPVLAVGLGYSF